MEQYNIIGQLRTYATTKGWKFLSGSNFMQNYEASQNEYINGQLILAADFNAKPIPTKAGRISSIRYTGVIALGIKFDDDGTPANLDETFIQKYDRRMLDLMQTLSGSLLAFVCDNELELVDADFRLELNKFDTNIDFVVGTVTIEQ